ncbi:MAG: hypothetical protein AB1631_32355 [Acidobacteriota bacterium]
MSEKIEIVLHTPMPTSATGELFFILKPEPSEEWKSVFLQVWDYQRQKKEITMEPLGKARIIGNQLIIKSSRLGSQTWQKKIVVEILMHVNQKMAASSELSQD